MNKFFMLKRLKLWVSCNGHGKYIQTFDPIHCLSLIERLNNAGYIDYHTSELID